MILVVIALSERAMDTLGYLVGQKKKWWPLSSTIASMPQKRGGSSGG